MWQFYELTVLLAVFSNCRKYSLQRAVWELDEINRHQRKLNNSRWYYGSYKVTCLRLDCLFGTQCPRQWSANHSKHFASQQVWVPQKTRRFTLSRNWRFWRSCWKSAEFTDQSMLKISWHRLWKWCQHWRKWFWVKTFCASIVHYNLILWGFVGSFFRIKVKAHLHVMFFFQSIWVKK